MLRQVDNKTELYTGISGHEATLPYDKVDNFKVVE